MLDICVEWLEQPHISLLDHGPGTFDRVRRVLSENGLPGQLSTDAYIAAVALEHEAVVHSADRDFERIAGLRVHNPLARSTRRTGGRPTHRARLR